MKKEIPILFSTDMVKALMDDRKTMTRRMIKTKYGGEPVSTVKNPGSDDIYVAFSRPDDSKLIEAVKCPYGKVGDLLWVRESFNKGQNGEIHFKADELGPLYEVKWKPSIHMPKAAARIWLEVTDVLVERLNEISNEDSIKEGILFIETETSFGYKLYGNHQISDILGRKAETGTELESFQTLFQHINGAESLNANPWVWVVSFKVVSKTGKP